MLSQQELKELLDYDPETGVFKWKVDHTCNVKIGTVAGTINNNGYLYIGVNNKSYRAHRLAWLYMTGSWPKDDIDHINGCKTDNRIENLRDVSNRDNQCNKTRHRNGRLPGASWHKRLKRWQARICINNESNFLGYFDTEFEAHEAYLTAKAQI
jgi:hypothetical protein